MGTQVLIDIKTPNEGGTKQIHKIVAPLTISPNSLETRVDPQRISNETPTTQDTIETPVKQRRPSTVAPAKAT
jgi:hypothetical protein